MDTNDTIAVITYDEIAFARRLNLRLSILNVAACFSGTAIFLAILFR